MKSLNTEILDLILLKYQKTTEFYQDIIDSGIISIEDLLTSKLQTFTKDLTELFNYAVLKGEYYHSDAENRIKAIEERERTLFNLLESSGFERKAEAALLKIQTENYKKKFRLRANYIDRNFFKKNNLRFDDVEIGVIASIYSFQEIVKEAKDSIENYTEHFIYIVGHVLARKEKKNKTLLDVRLNIELDDHLAHIKDYTSFESGRQSDKKIEAYLYALNIKLAQIDEGYTADRDMLNKLILHEVGLDDLREPVQGNTLVDRLPTDKWYAKVIKNKCNYLTLKIFRRLKKNGDISFLISSPKPDKKGSRQQREYSIGQFLKEKNLGDYIAFYTKSKYHYKEDDKFATLAEGSKEVSCIRQAIQQENLNTINIQDIHFFCKLIKQFASPQIRFAL